ncbi:hypothetical protein BDY24DRAFT_373140 [Mrakia frigida]|uniref:uncharacterized protein n=1 Tax=Mrakia frigida TaxID=29902 RepID=UPI003FCBFAB5
MDRMFPRQSQLGPSTARLWTLLRDVSSTRLLSTTSPSLTPLPRPRATHGWQGSAVYSSFPLALHGSFPSRLSSVSVELALLSSLLPPLSLLLSTSSPPTTIILSHRIPNPALATQKSSPSHVSFLPHRRFDSTHLVSGGRSFAPGNLHPSRAHTQTKASRLPSHTLLFPFCLSFFSNGDWDKVGGEFQAEKSVEGTVASSQRASLQPSSMARIGAV